MITTKINYEIHSEVIDLSYAISEEMNKYPKDPSPQVKITPARDENGAIYSGFTMLYLKSHHGTHIDAPAHKIKGGKTIDQYAPDKFIATAGLVDLTKYATRSIAPRGFIEVVEPEMLETEIKHIEQFLSLRSIEALILRTGYDQTITSWAKSSGFFSYLTPKSAEYLCSLNLPLKLIGIDSQSFDKRGSNSEVHREFLSRDILILETVVNLQTLAEKTGNKLFQLHAVPVNYLKADAAQCRAYAMVDANNKLKE
jgi:arylformamidase